MSPPSLGCATSSPPPFLWNSHPPLISEKHSLGTTRSEEEGRKAILPLPTTHLLLPCLLSSPLCWYKHCRLLITAIHAIPPALPAGTQAWHGGRRAGGRRLRWRALWQSRLAKQRACASLLLSCFKAGASTNTFIMATIALRSPPHLLRFKNAWMARRRFTIAPSRLPLSGTTTRNTARLSPSADAASPPHYRLALCGCGSSAHNKLRRAALRQQQTGLDRANTCSTGIQATPRVDTMVPSAHRHWRTVGRHHARAWTCCRIDGSLQSRIICIVTWCMKHG